MRIKSFHLFLLGLCLFYSCSKEDPDHIHDHSEITHVILKIKSSNEATQTIVWDSSEQNPETISLKANTDYNVQISFTNESDPDAIDNITLEIIEEADVHQVFYEFTEVSVTISSAANDTLDANGFPVLINSVWNASTTGTGIVQTYLIHEPSDKNSTNREGMGGFNDVSISIPISVVD